VTELAAVDQAWIHAKYGIPGDRYLDYAILRGDPSDGLPGVRGIGEKTASQLLAKYGSLDAILAAKDLSATIRAKLNASKDYVIAARTVVGPVLDRLSRCTSRRLRSATAFRRRCAAWSMP